jgi:8-oxo-dGTP pyrophosphatase MutT (NUDIX family)
MQQKVMAYLVRRGAARPELLVFEHRDHPDAGVQVPAGTVEPGEAIETALLRELREEAGLTPAQVRVVRKLAEAYEIASDQQRHVFELAPLTALRDRWTHTVRGAGEDQGLVFQYYWVPLTPALELAGDQHRFLTLT